MKEKKFICIILYVSPSWRAEQPSHSRARLHLGLIKVPWRRDGSGLPRLRPFL